LESPQLIGIKELLVAVDFAVHMECWNNGILGRRYGIKHYFFFIWSLLCSCNAQTNIIPTFHYSNIPIGGESAKLI